VNKTFLSLLSVCLAVSGVFGAEEKNAAEAFERMKSFAGDWEGTAE